MTNKDEATYDLTTMDGMTKAVTAYAKENPVLFAISPFGAIGAIIGEAVAKKVSEFGNHSEKVIEAQRKAAISVIREGKANGLKKVRVTLNQKAGIDIGSDLKGVPLKFTIGSDDQMTIEAEFA